MSETHIIEVKEMEDGSGDAYIEFPPVLFEKMKWKVGDGLKFLPKNDGSFIIKKVNLSSMELEFDDDELLKYMTLAHEKDQTFNEFIAEALEWTITKHEFESECG
jgi:hypothetical protein